MNKLTFVLGGARSGKSTYAERRAASLSDDVLFVATAEAGDGDMADRIARHRADRPTHWRTLEAPLNVGQAIEATQAAEVVVVDCLTLLVTNAMLAAGEGAANAEMEARASDETRALIAAWNAVGGQWIVISNEVGMGVVPPSRLGRVFRDALGRSNQMVAQAADEVLLLVAGLPWRLTPP